MPEPADLDTTDYGERDAASIRILGFFFTVLGLLVVVGTFFTLNDEKLLEKIPETEQSNTTTVNDATITSAPKDDSDSNKKHSIVVNKTRAAIVNATSGVVLTIVGIGMLWWAKRTVHPQVE